jgi:hypothetical protein
VVVYVIWFVLFELISAFPLVLCTGGFCFYPTRYLPQLVSFLMLFGKIGNIIPIWVFWRAQGNVVWQKENYISNFPSLCCSRECCLAKSVLHTLHNIRVSLYILPNNMCKRAGWLDPLTKL